MEPAVVIEQPANYFPQIFNTSMGYEGSALNAKERSKHGVLESNYHSYLKGKGKPLQPIESISFPEVEEIYFNNYYKANNLDRLPLRTAGAVFDWTIHSGSGNSIPALQKIVGATPDGKLGPKTIAAINAYIEKNGEDALLAPYFESRRGFIERFIKRNNRQDAPGLRNRVDKAERDWLRINHGIRNLKK